MPITILHLSDRDIRVLAYALQFILANWDEDMEDDLGLTEEEVRKLINDTGIVEVHP